MRIYENMYTDVSALMGGRQEGHSMYTNGEIGGRIEHQARYIT